MRLFLYGALTGEYVAELERATSAERANAWEIVLDLSNVTFVDRAALEFLCRARTSNISVQNVPSYVARWIELEGRCDTPPTEPSGR